MREKLVLRLSGRNQYEIFADDHEFLVQLNELDNQIVALLTRTEFELQALLEEMAAGVEAHGAILQRAVMQSDLVLPPADLTLEEAAILFKGDGLIPE